MLHAQAAGEVTYVEIKDVPPMGAVTIHFEENQCEEPEAKFTINGKDIETPYYSISMNGYGQITRIFDKRFEKEVLKKGDRANVLQVFEDKPLDNDAWDIDIFYQEKMREITELQKFEVVECGALQMAIRMEWKYMNSYVKQDMILYSNTARIDFRTTVDNHEKHQLLKAAFPVDIRSTYGT